MMQITKDDAKRIHSWYGSLFSDGTTSQKDDVLAGKIEDYLQENVDLDDFSLSELEIVKNMLEHRLELNIDNINQAIENKEE